MALKRRRFLFLGGVAAGGLVTGAVHRVFGSSDKDTPIASSTASSSPQPTATTVATKASHAPAAPKGMFAPPRGDVRIAVISDLNSQYGSTTYEREVLEAVQMLPDWKPDLVLCGGDMVAGQYPSLTKTEIEAMWEGFEKHLAAPIRRAKLPFGFTIGNHDASGALSVRGKPLFRQERELASAYWQDPRHDPGLQFVDKAGFPFYYTFAQNDIFYLVWDASSAIIPASQLAWAEKSLSGKAAKEAKLRIAIGHLPLYAVAVGREDPGEILADAEKLRSLLERYDVHTYISGHHHAYYPAHRGKLELLHTSALGSGPRPLLNSNLAPYKTLTIVDVDLAQRQTIYTTYNMSTRQVVDQSILPRLIPGPNGTILRRDVREADLTPAERALRFEPG